MRLRTLKQDKGQAGLTIFMSLIVMLFIIGLLVMVFSLMGSEVQESIASISEISTTAENVSMSANVTNTTTVAVTEAGKNDFAGTGTTLYITNHSGSLKLVPTSNWTMTSGGAVSIDNDAHEYVNTVANITYAYTYTGDDQSQDIMNDTITGISGAVDWFDIFVVIGAMVVLILLTVMIILAIRGSGMMAGGGGEGQGYSSRNEGSA